MEDEDLSVRAELAADGSLFEGYHPRMEEVHVRNAARLVEILDRHGWPGRALVGEDGARAAWRVLIHAIANPPLMRRGLGLLKEATEQGEVPPLQPAMVEDRIRTFEGRGQLYGTQWAWDEDGRLSPLPIEDPAGVDERRRPVGLGPLEDEVALARSGEKPPSDVAEFTRRQEEWFRAVGWRE